jgi:hypothetical protein
MANVQIELTEEAYRLVIDGTPTEAAGYGESIEVDVDGHTYLALLDTPEDGGDEIESKLANWLYVDGVGVDVDPVDVDGFEGDDVVDDVEGGDDADDVDATDETAS